jgi:PAS domain S-box-containing protein
VPSRRPSKPRAAPLAPDPSRGRAPQLPTAALLGALWDGPLALGCVDRELRLIAANPALAALAGGDVGLGQPLCATLPWLATAIGPALTRLAAPGAPSVPVTVDAGPGPGGGPRHRVTLAPLEPSGAGPVIALILAPGDDPQGARTRFERELLLSEVQRQAAEKEATLTAIADGLLIYGPAGQLLYTNPAAQDLLGFTDRERGLPLLDRIRALAPTTPDGRPLAPEQAPGARALRGERVRGALLVLHRGGRKTWLNVSAAPIPGPVGERLGAVVTLADVTALHELEVQRDELLRAVSHDLRTPLTLVLLHAQLLRQQQPGAADLGSADQILVAARRIDGMIEELVESSRLQAGQLDLELRPVMCHTVLAEALARAAAFVDPGRVRLEVAPDVPAVEVDPDRLARAVVNLLRSAEGYSDEGATIRVRVVHAGHELVVGVTAQGPGIPEEEVPLLFERLRRPKGAKRIEGLGLGLFIARLVVEKHGGRVWAETVPGRECTFFFSVPTA